jgi:ribonuclease P protein component
LNTQNTLTVFERIKSKKYFELLFSKEAKVIHEKNILAKWAIIPKDDACLAKVAFVVPKRICKKATERNYFKRILKESYRTSKHNLIEGLKKPDNIYFIQNLQDILPLDMGQLPKFKQFVSKVIDARRRAIGLVK